MDLTQTTEGTFALCDFLNYGQTLIDCIAIIGKIYGLKYNSQNDCSSFHQKGNNGKGNDEKYFKYLRSLCAVHPLATTAHGEYQGEQPEWCPYINIGSSTSCRMLAYGIKELKGADYIARVYRNDMEFSKYVPIKVKQLFNYIQKRYGFINNIIQAIERYNQNQITFLKNKHILLPSECDSYDSYLQNLEDEIATRYGKSGYEARTWRAIYRTHFEDEENENVLNKYQEEMRRGIENIHNGLQNMECISDDWSFNVVKIKHLKELQDYGYEDEKIFYLFPCGVVEDKENEDFSFIDCTLEVDKDRINGMLETIEVARQRGATHEDLRGVARYIDNKAHTTNAEWARIQLKIMEPILGKFIKLNYFLNNWHLYLQTEIAKWLLSKEIINGEKNG